MSLFQRIKNILRAAFTIIFAVILLFIADNNITCVIIALVLSFFLLIYGFRLLIYYFRMARHMVGGKNSLFQAIILLDLSLFTVSITSLDSIIILLYLVGVFAFSGAIDILRALEQKKLSSPGWKLKLLDGSLSVVFVIIIVIVSIFTKSKELVIYGFCATLFKSAIMKIISAFRKTSVIYIQ